MHELNKWCNILYINKIIKYMNQSDEYFMNGIPFYSFHSSEDVSIMISMPSNPSNTQKRIE